MYPNLSAVRLVVNVYLDMSRMTKEAVFPPRHAPAITGAEAIVREILFKEIVIHGKLKGSVHVLSDSLSVETS